MCNHGRISQLSKIMNENNLKKDQGNVGTKKIRSWMSHPVRHGCALIKTALCHCWVMKNMLLSVRTIYDDSFVKFTVHSLDSIESFAFTWWFLQNSKDLQCYENAVKSSFWNKCTQQALKFPLSDDNFDRP